MKGGSLQRCAESCIEINLVSWKGVGRDAELVGISLAQHIGFREWRIVGGKKRNENEGRGMITWLVFR